MPKDYLDPKQNPWLPQGLDEDNPGAVSPPNDDGPLMADPEGYGMPEVVFEKGLEGQIRDFLSGRSFFAVYKGDEFLFSAKLDEAGRIVIEAGGETREPSSDELKQIAAGIVDKREG